MFVSVFMLKSTVLLCFLAGEIFKNATPKNKRLDLEKIFSVKIKNHNSKLTKKFLRGTI